MDLVVLGISFLVVSVVWGGVGKYVQRRFRNAHRARTIDDLLALDYYMIVALCVAREWRQLVQWWHEGFAQPGFFKDVDPLPQVILSVQLGAYLALSWVVWVYPRRRDALLMCLHHLITALIIVLCNYAGYDRACVTILWLHDICDVPLLLMTQANRHQWPRIRFFMYCCTLPLFAVCRLVLFPLITIVAITTHPTWSAILIVSCNGVLWFMHVYWTKAMVVQGVRWVQGKQVLDLRDHKPSANNDDQTEEATNDEELSPFEEEDLDPTDSSSASVSPVRNNYHYIASSPIEQDLPVDEEREEEESQTHEPEAPNEPETIGARVRRRRAKKIE